MPNEVDIEVKAKDSTSVPVAGIQKNVENSMQKSGSAVVKFGSQIGGELGELVSKGGEALESFGASGQKMNAKVAAVGGTVAGLGLAFQALGSADKAAEQQLEAAVDATGHSVDEYSAAIDKAKSKGEDFGHSAADVDNALAKMTEQTGSANTALEYMPLVMNLAAAKHESLTTAAQQVGQVLGGNTKILKQYGINIDAGTATTQQLTDALGELSDKLNGQAAAATNTFSGKIDSAKEHVLDFASQIGNEVGPAMTFFGTAVGIGASAVDILASRQGHAVVATEAATVATVEDTVAKEADTVATAELAVSNEALAVSQEASSIKGAGAAAAFVAVGVGAYYGGKAIASMVDSGNSWNKTMEDGKKNTAAFSDAIKADGDAVGENTTKAVYAALQQNGLADRFKNTSITLADLSGALMGNDDQFNTTLATWKKSGQVSDDTALSLVVLHSEFKNGQISADEYSTALAGLGATEKDMAVDAQNAAKAEGTVNDALAGAKASADVASQAFSEVANKGEDMYKSSLTASDSIAALATNVDQAKQAHDKFATSLDTSTASGRANVEAVLSVIDNINQLTLKSQQAGDTTQVTSQKVDGLNSSLYDTATKAGLGKQGLQDLVNQYETNPKTFAYQITVDTNAALAAISTLQGKIAFVNSLKVTNPSAYAAAMSPETSSTYQRQTGGTVGGAATGGNRNGVITWAEHGDEMAKLPNGSYVYSNPDTERMLATQGGGGGAVQVTFASGGGQLEDLLLEMIRKNVRVLGGGNVQNAFGY